MNLRRILFYLTKRLGVLAWHILFSYTLNNIPSSLWLLFLHPVICFVLPINQSLFPCFTVTIIPSPFCLFFSNFYHFASLSLLSILLSTRPFVRLTLSIPFFLLVVVTDIDIVCFYLVFEKLPKMIFFLSSSQCQLLYIFYRLNSMWT